MSDLPHQVQSLIDGINNTKDSVFIRDNFKNRLVDIRDAIDKSLKRFEAERAMYNNKTRK